MISTVKPFIASCDPGKTGALALINSDGDLVELVDMPISTWKGKKKLVFKAGQAVETYEEKWSFDKVGIADTLYKWYAIHGCDVLWIEKIAVRPGISAHSAFTMGLNEGLVQGVAVGIGFTVNEVTPQKWKATLKVTEDKKSSLNLARSTWPDSDLFKKTADHNRAEAALIGLYGLRHGG